MNIFYDDRDKITFLEDLKKQGVDAVPKFYPIQLLHDEKYLNGIELNGSKIFHSLIFLIKWLSRIMKMDIG